MDCRYRSAKSECQNICDLSVSRSSRIYCYSKRVSQAKYAFHHLCNLNKHRIFEPFSHCEREIESEIVQSNGSRFGMRAHLSVHRKSAIYLSGNYKRFLLSFLCALHRRRRFKSAVLWSKYVVPKHIWCMLQQVTVECGSDGNR